MRTHAIIAFLLLSAASAQAEEIGVTHQLAADAGFTPGIVRAAAGTESAFANAATGWSGAADKVQVDAYGEVRVYGPLRLVVQVADAFGDAAKPGVGAGMQLLREGTHGIDGAAYARYKTEGFSEPEGELELTFAMARHFGAVHGALDLSYGQDPEGNERDAEIATVGQVELSHGLFGGATARYRDALGSTKEAIARDGFGGATGTYAIGPVALTAMAGVAMVQSVGATRKFGPAATLAIGAAF
jgi:hypothetical protein